MIKILSVQSPSRKAKSSILRLYESLKDTNRKVDFLCIGNDIFHRIFGNNKHSMENFKWQLVFNFSFWYFPSLIPIKWIDLILSRRWVISYVDQLKLDANGKEVLVIAEAGPSSIIVNELLSKYKNIKIHYRINDNINSFRIPSAL